MRKRLHKALNFFGITAIFRSTKRQLILQLIEAFHSFLFSYMQFKIYWYIFNNQSPLVVVLTGSMLPGFVPGDILFLYTRDNSDYHVGEMTVFQFFDDKIPIVHRAIKKFGNEILTKGDNNSLDDLCFYEFGQVRLYPENIKSRVVAYIPFLGKLAIFINKFPILKVFLFVFTFAYTFLFRSK